MSEDISLDHIPTVTMRKAQTLVVRAMVRGIIVAMYGGSGVGKTTMVDLLADTVTPEQLAHHPSGDVTHVVTYTGLAAPMYDGISIRGPIIAGESYDCAHTGRTRVLSDLASPVWYTDIIEILAANPHAHVVVPIDEINLGQPDLHSNLLPLLDRKGLGPHQFSARDRGRISFILMGNPPEALPSESNMSGPLALRVRKWFKVKTDATDIIQFLEERGELAPEVEWVLKEYPDLAEVPGVNGAGNIGVLNNLLDDNDDDADDDANTDDFQTPIVNGVNPRKWHAISQEMIYMRHDPDYADMKPSEKRDELRTMCHQQIADQLVNAMEMADTFATMADVERDPENCMVPDGMLLQSMQMRALLPRINDANVAAFIIYADRFNQTARSGIMSFLLRRLKTEKTGKTAGLLGSGSLKLSPTAIKQLYQRYLGDLTSQVAEAVGIENIQIDLGVTPAPAPVPAPVAAPAATGMQPPVPAPQWPPAPVAAAPAVPPPAPAPAPAPVQPAHSPTSAADNDDDFHF